MRISATAVAPIAVALLAASGTSGCGSQPRSWSILPPLFQSASATMPPRPDPASVGPGSPSAALIEVTLRNRGLRFGTDGSMGAIYEYMRGRHRAIATRNVRAGDVVFFELEIGRSWGCGTHGGIVEAVDSTGRISFREWRDGGVRRSYLHTGEPRTRRDAAGRVINSFLRPKHPDDEASARYFAGEMLCAVIRPVL